MKFVGAGIAALALPNTPASAADKEKPNILLIIVDANQAAL